MSDAEFIDDRGEAGPEDNVEWLRWAADMYASAVAKGGCYAPEPDWDVDAISPGLREAAAEIERLRVEVGRQRAHKEALYVCVAMIERAAAGAIYSQEMIHAMALGALKILEAKP